MPATAPPGVDLSRVPVVDGHAHPLRADPLDITPEAFADLFTEARPGTMGAHVPHTGYHRRTLGALARWLGVEPTVPEVLAARRARGPEGGRALVAGSGVAAALIDTGYPPGAMDLQAMGRWLDLPLHEVFRTETCAEALLSRPLGYQGYLAAYREALHGAAARAVAFKSIVAYRSGLAVEPPRGEAAARAHGAMAERVAGGGSPRLTDKALLDALFQVTLEVARETGRPLQLHTGFGDPDLDLRLANPLHLRPIVEDERWRSVPIVLLHLAYPYVREAAYLAAVWPQVHLDLSLAIPILGAGVIPSLVDALSQAPASKLLYGSDVGALPELFALTADWGRAALGEALGWLVERDGLAASAALAAGRQVLHDNAVALYGLERLGGATPGAGA